MVDKIRIAEAVNAKTISLDDAPRGYQRPGRVGQVRCAGSPCTTLASGSRISASQRRLFAQARDGPSRRNGQGSGARVTRLYQTYLRRTGSRRRRRGSPLQGARRCRPVPVPVRVRYVSLDVSWGLAAGVVSASQRRRPTRPGARGAKPPAAPHEPIHDLESKHTRGVYP